MRYGIIVSNGANGAFGPARYAPDPPVSFPGGGVIRRDWGFRCASSEPGPEIFVSFTWIAGRPIGWLGT